MKLWEYKKIHLDTEDPLQQQQLFNAEGAQGWECYWIFQVGGGRAWLFFKRELAAPAPAAPPSGQPGTY